MLSINTNLSSLIVQNSIKQSTNRLNTAIERLTTGFKINHAKDNAANYNIATNMTTKLGALQVAEDNCAMGLDMLATANGTLDQIHDKLQRLRDLAVQASNGTYGEKSKEAINQEANALVDEIERIYNTTEYNGINVMKGQVTGVEESKFIKDIDRRDTSRMTTLASVDPDKALTSGTYSISTPEELAKLATMTNNGLIGAGTEFVLANDIDLSGYANWTPIGYAKQLTWQKYEAKEFHGIFDGNGYIISNVKINTPTSICVGLFSIASDAVIKNLGVTSATIAGNSSSGVLLGQAENNVIIENCYTTGTVSGNGHVGGMVGLVSNSTVMDCYSSAEVDGAKNVGGLIGSTNIVNGENYLTNSYGIGIVSASSGDSVGALIGKPVGVTISNSDTAFQIPSDSKINSLDSIISIQVGTNSDFYSQILVGTGYSLDGLGILRNIGYGSGDYLVQCDFLLDQLSKKLTEIASSSNRLESAFEEISVQYENLVSSRSTLRDADIADISSEYIRQQILQQASTTLLSTANQSPSIALSLI